MRRVTGWTLGNGIVPYVTPYEKNYISIDPTALAADVELSATEREIIARANSTTMVTFTTKTGKAMLFDVKMRRNAAADGRGSINSRREICRLHCSGWPVICT